MTSLRRLPGFSFEVQPPPPVDILPGMDVPVFVGFAASGPLNLPVAVEDASYFNAIFGPDIALAWNSVENEQVYAYLGPAVRAFFRNGGRRCWVIRVAGKALPNFFAVPGLLQLQFREGLLTGLRPALARARSEGSWSDNLNVQGLLEATGLEALQFNWDKELQQARLVIRPGSANPVGPGEMVRLTFPASGYSAALVVEKLETLTASYTASPPVIETLQVLTGRQVLWFRQHGEITSPPALPEMANLISPDTGSQAVQVLSYEEQNGLTTLGLNLNQSKLPQVGALVRISFSEEELWLVVQAGRPAMLDGSPPVPGVEVSGVGLWWQKNPPAFEGDFQVLAGDFGAERLTFELRVRQAEEQFVRLNGLAPAPLHARFWGNLPDDAQLFADSTEVSGSTRPALWDEATNPRFPLTGLVGEGALFLPLTLPLQTPDEAGALALSSAQLQAYGLPEADANAWGYQGATPPDTLTRAGLASFNEQLFLDPALADKLSGDLLAEADFIRYESSQPRLLTGLHAALGVEEATLIAVPDAVHLGWQEQQIVEVPPPPEPSQPEPRPQWWHFLGCEAASHPPLVSQPPEGYFLDCDLRVLKAPSFEEIEQPADSNNYTLRWTAPGEPIKPGEKIIYRLEEATFPDYRDAVTVYLGPDLNASFYGRSQGVYYYRVRVEIGDDVSDWSVGVLVQVGGNLKRWVQVIPGKNYFPNTLLAVQRCLLRLCAARGDLMAVLAAPLHYREKELLEYLRVLKQPGLTAADPGSTSLVEPLTYGETLALSYGALYHPWPVELQNAQGSELRTVPPEGAISGMIAQRTLDRGAWLAPANLLLQEVIALRPSIQPAFRLDLQEAQCNLLRQEASGFLTMSALTLSPDESLQPINVRRLLILLRRLALREGAKYVFEPNSNTFRRSVQRGFEGLLEYLFERGAFAGDTPGTAYQVVVDNTVNPPQSLDQGRLIIELRVAPSLPLTFVTIRLVQTNNQTTLAEGI
ncbi:MAG TPA: hypothetical protein VH186_16670 [Chloroflexia bacterium]|nr:hypothetical protein [Chloroflexia bacterium]